MGVRDCQVCPECGSTMAEDPSSHMEPGDHEWEIGYSERNGDPKWWICQKCMETRRYHPSGPDASVDAPAKDET